MAQLTGISKRTVVTYIEVVADDNSAVLMISREGDKTMFRTRLPHEDRWNADSPRFTVKDSDTGLLAAVVGGADVTWQTAKLAEITGSSFSLPDPNPKVDEAEQQRCAELDIERAKAENLREQREIIVLELAKDHARDLHMARDVEGCIACENRIRPGHGDGSLRDSQDPNDPSSVAFGSVGNVDAPDEELPF